MIKYEKILPVLYVTIITSIVFIFGFEYYILKNATSVNVIIDAPATDIVYVQYQLNDHTSIGQYKKIVGYDTTLQIIKDQKVTSQTYNILSKSINHDNITNVVRRDTLYTSNENNVYTKIGKKTVKTGTKVKQIPSSYDYIQMPIIK